MPNVMKCSAVVAFSHETTNKMHSELSPELHNSMLNVRKVDQAEFMLLIQVIIWR